MPKRKSSSFQVSKVLISAVILFLVSTLGLTVLAVQQQTNLGSQAASSPRTLGGIINHVGPGELSDVTITSDNLSNSNSGVTATFIISGNRVGAETKLVGFWPTGTTANRIDFTKFGNTFQGNAAFYSTCIDLQNGLGKYLASYCVRNSLAGVNKSDQVYGATGPTQTLNDTVRMHFTAQGCCSNPGLPIQSVSAAYDKSVTPNFAPTNFYWRAHPSLVSALKEVTFLFEKSPLVTCSMLQAQLGVFDSIAPQTNPPYYLAPKFDQGCIHATTDIGKPDYNQFDTKMIALLPPGAIGSALSPVNLLNGSFEADSDNNGIPDSWIGSGLTANDKRSTVAAKDGTASFVIKNDSAVAKTLTQDLTGSWPVGTQFLLSGFAKAIQPTQGGAIIVGAKVYYSDNTNEFIPINFPMTGKSYDWQKIQGMILLAKPANKISILVSSNTINEVYFDNISFNYRFPLDSLNPPTTNANTLPQ